MGECPAGLFKHCNMISDNIRIERIQKDKLMITYPDLAEIGYHEVNAISDKLKDNMKGGPLKLLSVLGNQTEFTIEGKMKLYLDNRKRKRSILAEAIVIPNNSQVLMEKFYRALIREHFVVCFFKNVETAMTWLNDQNSRRPKKNNNAKNKLL